MSYLIGNFTRSHFEWDKEDKDPFYGQIKIIDDITREHLGKAKDDDSYQIINLITREYFNPASNKWIKIKRE